MNDEEINLIKKKNELELKKLEKENLKLDKELRFLSKPLLNPTNWSPLATIIAAVFALIWASLSGWFTNQNDLLKNQKNSLENQKMILEIEISKFQNQKEIIEDSIKQIRVEKMMLLDSANKLSRNYFSSRDQNEKLQNKLNSASNIKIDLDVATPERFFAPVLCGFVLDVSSHEPIPGAIFVYKGYRFATLTNRFGFFYMKIYSKYADSNLRFSILDEDRSTQLFRSGYKYVKQEWRADEAPIYYMKKVSEFNEKEEDSLMKNDYYGHKWYYDKK